MKIVCLLGLALLAALEARAQINSYTATPIIDSSLDHFMINPWGMSRPVDPALGENEWWLSDNGTGLSTLYSVNKQGIQTLSPLIISIPAASGSGAGPPTGTVYNGTMGPGPGVNNFTFATLDGTISNWNAGAKPPPGGSQCFKCHVAASTIKVNNSAKRASYFGLTIATNATTGAPTYYATNFTSGRVEAYDATTFKPVRLTGKFSDNKIPRTYKAYGIQTIGASIWVSYFDNSSGGYVDSFDSNGKLKTRLATGSFSEPWGMAQAPADFGAFNNSLLVGNTTSGMIGAYDPVSGAFQGFLQDSAGRAIVIPGLWGISFGNGNKKSGPVNTLYYAAGGDDYLTGVFGQITAN